MQVPPSPAATVLRYQSNLQDHASRLAGQLEGLASTTHERDQEIAQLSHMLQELRQKSSKKKVDTSSVSFLDDGAMLDGNLHPLPAALLLTSRSEHAARQSEEGSEAVDKGLGALNDANMMFSQFQQELEDELSLLAFHADTARVTASAMRAQLGALRQVCSPPQLQQDGLDAALMAQHLDGEPGQDSSALFAQTPFNPKPMRSLSPVRQVLTPSGEAASLWQLLQEAATQRARAESALRAGPPAMQASSSPLWRLLGPFSPLTVPVTEPDAEQAVPDAASGKAHAKADAGGKADVADAGQPRRASNDTSVCQKDQQEQAGSGGVHDAPRNVEEAVRKEAYGSSTQDAETLRAGIAALLAQRTEVLALLSSVRTEYQETSSKVAAAAMELEGVSCELEDLRVKAQQEQAHLQHMQQKRLTEEQMCVTVSKQLHDLQQQLAEQEARLERLADMQAQAQEAAAPSTGEMVPSKPRIRRRAKRQAIRRSVSCSDLAAAMSAAPVRPVAHALPPVAPPTHGQASTSSRQKARHHTSPSVAQTGMQTDALSGLGCILCSCLKDQVAAAQKHVCGLQEQVSRAQQLLEQERQSCMGKEGELALVKQRLRSVLAEGGSGVSSGGTWGSSGGARRPLTMAGWEDLIDEASADLERLEEHVCTSTQRLIELQAQNVQLVQAMGKAAQQKLEAEQAVLQAEMGLREARLVNEKLEATAIEQRQLCANVESQAAAARSAMHDLQQQLVEQQADFDAKQETLSATLSLLQETEQKLLHMQRDQNDMQEQQAQLAHDLQLSSSQLASSKQLAAQAAIEAAEAREQAAATQQQRDQQETQLRALSADVHAAELRKQEVEDEVAQLKIEMQRVGKELESLLQTVHAAELKLCTEEEGLQRMQGERAKLMATLHDLRDELGTAQQRQQSTTAELERVQQQVQVASDELRRYQQEANAAASKQQHAEEQLARLSAQITSAQQQLSEVQMQAAAAQRQVLQHSAAGIMQTPGGLINLQLPGSAGSPTGKENGGVRRSLNLRGSSVAAFMQLQGEAERLQVQLSQAESKRRVAEQRAQDSEQLAEELQLRVSALQKAQRQAAAAAADLPSDSGTAARLHAKVEELESEVEAANRLAKRLKSKLTSTQDEVSTLEDSLQRERATGVKLKQQLAEAQAAAAHLGTAPTSYWQNTPDLGHSQAQLHKLQQQIVRHQELNSELLEEQRQLRQQCQGLREQLDSAATEQQHARQQMANARKALQELAADKAEVEIEIADLQASRALEQQRVSDARRTCAQMEDAVQELQHLQEGLEGQLGLLQDQVQHMREERAALQHAAVVTQEAKVTLACRDAQQARQQLQKAEAAHSALVQELQTRIEQQEQDAERLQAVNMQLEARMQVLQRVSQTRVSPAGVPVAVQTQQSSAFGDLDVERAQLQAVKDELGATTRALSQTQQQVAAAAREHQRLQDAVAALCAERDGVEEELEGIRQQLEVTLHTISAQPALAQADAGEDEAEDEVQEQVMPTPAPAAVRYDGRVLQLEARAAAVQATQDAERTQMHAQVQQLQDQLAAALHQLRHAEAAVEEAHHQQHLAVTRARRSEVVVDARDEHVDEVLGKLQRSEDARRAAELRCAELEQAVSLAVARAAKAEHAVEQQEGMVAQLEAQLVQAHGLHAGLSSALAETEELRGKVAALNASLSQSEGVRAELARSQAALFAAQDVTSAARQEAAGLQAEVAQLQLSLATTQEAAVEGQAAAAVTGVQMVQVAEAAAAEQQAIAAKVQEQLDVARAQLEEAQIRLERERTEASGTMQQVQAQLQAASMQLEEALAQAAAEASQAESLHSQLAEQAQFAEQLQQQLASQAMHTEALRGQMDAEAQKSMALRALVRDLEAQQGALEASTSHAEMLQAQADLEAQNHAVAQARVRELEAQLAASEVKAASVQALVQQAHVELAQQSVLMDQLRRGSEAAAHIKVELEAQLTVLQSQLAAASAELAQERAQAAALREAAHKPDMWSVSCQAGEERATRSVWCQASEDRAVRYVACQTDLDEARSCRDAATGTPTMRMFDVSCQTEHSAQWPDLHTERQEAAAARSALAAAREAGLAVSEEVRARQQELGSLKMQVAEQRAVLARLTEQLSAAAAAEARHRAQEASVAELQVRLGSLQAQEAAAAARCKALQQAAAAVRSEVHGEMAAVAAALQAAAEQWGVSRYEMERECEALHDMRVSLLTDAVQARHELQRAVAVLRPADAVRAAIDALGTALVHVGPFHPDRAAITTAVQCAQRLHTAVAQLMAPASGLTPPVAPVAAAGTYQQQQQQALMLPSSTGTYGSLGPTPSLLSSPHTAAAVASIGVACGELARDVAQLQAQAAAGGELLGMVHLQAKRTFVHAHTKAKALSKALAEREKLSVGVRGATGNAGPPPASQLFQEMWSPIEEQLGKLLKVCVHGLQQQQQGGSRGQAQAAVGAALGKQLVGACPQRLSSTLASVPGSTVGGAGGSSGSWVSEVEARLAHVTALAKQLEEELQQAASQLGGGTSSPPIVHVQPVAQLHVALGQLPNGLQPPQHPWLLKHSEPGRGGWQRTTDGEGSARTAAATASTACGHALTATAVAQPPGCQAVGSGVPERGANSTGVTAQLLRDAAAALADTKGTLVGPQSVQPNTFPLARSQDPAPQPAGPLSSRQVAGQVRGSDQPHSHTGGGLLLRRVQAMRSSLAGGREGRVEGARRGTSSGSSVSSALGRGDSLLGVASATASTSNSPM